ncbi:MAG: sugar phosphate isomerase/epimerase [Chloroflexota bacterium]
MTKQTALQLYSVRDAIAQDFEDTMQRIAAMGFTHVETAFWPEHISVTQAGQLLRDMNFTVIGMHCEVPSDDAQKAAWLEMAEAYDCTRMIWHGWPHDNRYHSLDDSKHWADIYNEANAFARTNGLSFGLHNHWWEFEDAEGHLPFYALLDYLEPDVFFELDMYWVQVAGLNPAKVVADFGERVQLLHVKDGPAVHGPDSHVQVAAGTGAVDIPAVIQAAGDVVDTLVIEFDDCATDVVDAVEVSYEYLRVM